MAKPNLDALAAKIAPTTVTALDQRQPTQASIPIAAPLPAPIVHVFSPAPTLSPAQRAAATRAGRLAGILPAKPAKGAKAAPTAPVETRGEGVKLVLRIVEHASHLRIEFAFEGASAPKHEQALENLHLEARANGSSEASGHGRPRCDLRDATVATVRNIIPLMEDIERFLSLAHEQSEDFSFAQTVLALTGRFRADRIELRQLDHSEVRTVKRGAAYITAHKACEVFLARKEAEAAPEPAAT